jgi:hypothetical protein
MSAVFKARELYHADSSSAIAKALQLPACSALQRDATGTGSLLAR